MSSTSIIDSPNSSESLNGLTIGHKIYFEDVGIGGNLHKSDVLEVGVATGASSPSPTKKMKGVVHQSSRCQVDGCNVDLSDVKAYYSKHKVCLFHSKSSVVTVGGVQKRFCQQCSRFHQLPEFDQEKRSCRRRLAGHNERRRKPAPMSFLTSHCGSSSVFDTKNQGRGFLLDFSKNSGIPDIHYEKSSDRRSALEGEVNGKVLMHQWTNSYESPSSGNYLHNTGADTNFPCQEIPSGEYYTDGVSSDSTRALSLLSNEPRSASNLEVLNNSVINLHNSAVMNHVPSGSIWGYNGNESAGNLGHGQFSQHEANLYSNEHGVVQQDIRPELSSRFYESVQQMHWSL